MSTVIDELVVKVNADAAGFKSAFADVKNILSGPAGIAVAAGAAAVAIGAYVGKITEAAGEIYDLSQKTGIGIEAVQELKYMTEQTGASFGAVQSAIAAMTRGLDANADSYAALGVSIRDATGEMRPSQEIFEDTLLKLSAMENKTDRAALGMKLFGKGAAELAPLMNEGAAGIEEMKNRAHELGLVMSDELVTSGEGFGDTMADMKASFEMLGSGFVEAILPNLQAVAEVITDKIIPAFRKMGDSALFKYFTENLNSIIKFVGEVVNVIANILSGDWGEAWKSLRRIVLIYTKYTLDAISLFVNGAIALINVMIKGINSLASKIGMKEIAEIAAVNLSTLTGVNQALEASYEKTEAVAKKTYKNITLDMKAQKEEQAAVVAEADAKEIDAAKAKQEALLSIEAQSSAESQRLANARGDAIVAEAKKAEEAELALSDAISSVGQSLAAILEEGIMDAFSALGRNLWVGAEGAKGFANSMKLVLKSILDALPSLLLQAGLALLPVNLPLGLGLMAAAGVAALAKGVADVLLEVPGLAAGTDYATGGPTLVGERGPELVQIPRGAQVVPNDRLASGVGNVINIYSPVSVDVGEANRIFKRTMRELSFAGGIA